MAMPQAGAAFAVGAVLLSCFVWGVDGKQTVSSDVFSEVSNLFEENSREVETLLHGEGIQDTQPSSPSTFAQNPRGVVAALLVLVLCCLVANAARRGSAEKKFDGGDR